MDKGSPGQIFLVNDQGGTCPRQQHVWPSPLSEVLNLVDTKPQVMSTYVTYYREKKP